MQMLQDPNAVTKLSRNRFLVKSQHGTRMAYHVTVTDNGIWTCECDDFMYRLTRKEDKYCKHIIICLAVRDTLQEKKIPTICQPKVCPRCNGTTIRKNGFRIIKNDQRRQRYSCKRCNYQFSQNENKFAMAYSDPKIITESLNLVMSGMSYRNAARHIHASHGITISHVSVLNWIGKYTKIIKEYVESFYPELGDVWSLDEMVLNIKDTEKIKKTGFYEWLWNIIDPQTRFLIASQVSKRRDIQNAKNVIVNAKEQITKNPKYVITDSLAAYDEAIREEFKNRVAHVKTLSIQQGFVNRPVERYHNEIREKLKSRRGLGNQKSAQTFAELYKIHHNFVKPHQGLNGKTPAEAAGIDLNLGEDKYLDLIKLAINHKNKTYGISKQLGNRTKLVEIINEKDSTRVVQKEWIKKKTWREINDILRLNGFCWVPDFIDENHGCWINVPSLPLPPLHSSENN